MNDSDKQYSLDKPEEKKLEYIPVTNSTNGNPKHINYKSNIRPLTQAEIDELNAKLAAEAKANGMSLRKYLNTFKRA